MNVSIVWSLKLCANRRDDATLLRHLHLDDCEDLNKTIEREQFVKLVLSVGDTTCEAYHGFPGDEAHFVVHVDGDYYIWQSNEDYPEIVGRIFEWYWTETEEGMNYDTFTSPWPSTDDEESE